MSLYDEMKNEIYALQNAAQIARSISQHLNEINIPKTQYPLPSNVDALIPALNLTIPADVMAPISHIKVPDNLRNLISQRLERFVGDLQQKYESSYKHTCLETLRGTNSTQHLEAIHRVYLSLSQRHLLPLIQSQVAFAQREIAKYQPHADNKRPFNNEFTPALEKYFELNGYPSVAHRSILAQKSGMIPRQIEVWFQNHRNRAKKEGKVVQRLDSHFPLRQALSLSQGGLVNCVNRLPTPPTEVIYEKSKDVSSHSTRNLLGTTLLDDSHPLRPLHAFPSTKNSDYPDPFPNDNGSFKFPSPVWRRKPASSPNLSSAIDMDGFIQMFHLKLNFAENTRQRGFSPVKSESPSPWPWFTSTTTFNSCAPHPSLVRTSRPNSSAPVVSLESHISIPTFGSISLPISTVSLPVPSAQAPARKVRPLPRRLPPRSQMGSFGSRTSSFSSDASGSRSSSSSSNHSSSSPELSTPPSPHVNLPVVLGGTLPQDLFDFSYTTLDLDYSLSDFLPFQDFHPSNAYPSSNKLTDISFLDTNFPDFSHNLEGILS